MSTTETGYIVWASNPTKVLGVADQQAGAGVVLVDSTAPGYFNLWTVDLLKNTITNAGSGGDLVLQYQDNKIASQTPLVLGVLGANGQPQPSQQWSLLYRPGYIASVAEPSLVVDNSHRGGDAGNAIWAFPFNGSPAQQWKIESPFSFVARQAA